MSYALTNCTIYTGEEILCNKAIIITNKTIEKIVSEDKVQHVEKVIDLGGASIAPGFIDIQVNGGGGVLFNDTPTVEAIGRMFEAHKQYGTTNFLPTLITDSKEKMLEAIDAVKGCLRENHHGVLGLHLEGPYLNKNKAGVHDKSFIREVTATELEEIIERGAGTIKIMTVAPEVNDENLVKKMLEHDIRIAAGHTNATYEEANYYFNYGVNAVTHLFNAMSQFGSREPGVVGATYDRDDVWASVIVDGHHVHFTSVKISKEIKKEKLLLVTDAMPPVGKENYDFQLGNYHVLHENGKCTTEDGTLAGSALDMATAVRNCVNHVGIPLEEALKMASTYVATYLGLSDRLGKVKPGYDANLVIFNDNIEVTSTIINGQYEKVNLDTTN